MLPKPLDFVRTPKGAIALVTETNDEGRSASIRFLGGGSPTGEKSAWWEDGDGLVVIDSLPRLLADATAHPFGRGRYDVAYFFPLRE